MTTDVYGMKDLAAELEPEDFQEWVLHDGQEIEIIDHNAIDEIVSIEFKDGYEIHGLSIEHIEQE
jgi:hypothetical protein